MRPLYLALLHHPILNRRGETVTTSVTNLDIHDISRTACTYGAKKLYIVTPIVDQHELVGRILAHWERKEALEHHPDRVRALGLVCLKTTIEEALAEIVEAHGEAPEVWMTDARPRPVSLSYRDARESVSVGNKPILVVLGTGWGVAQEVNDLVSHWLDPIYGPKSLDYNHLSVRGAAAVILDRLVGH